ncbi:hypothetical protein EV208_11360 [Christensenella hongkongensis]|nr:hypothetical protein EV208_11360 [Christensenella hongkongensis]
MSGSATQNVYKNLKTMRPHAASFWDCIIINERKLP